MAAPARPGQSASAAPVDLRPEPARAPPSAPDIWRLTRGSSGWDGWDGGMEVTGLGVAFPELGPSGQFGATRTAPPQPDKWNWEGSFIFPAKGLALCLASMKI